MQKLSWWLYQLLVTLVYLVAAPFLLVRRGRHYLETLSGRLGFYPQETQVPSTAPIWIHAVSVGEVNVAATLIRSLKDMPLDGAPPGVTPPLVVSTVTPTGQAQARKLFSVDGIPVAYLPFDLGFPIRRFMQRFYPSALILVEGDYWPLVLRIAKERQMPIAVVNGRVGKRSLERMSKFPKLSRALFFDPVDRFGLQSAEDYRRLAAAGAPEERLHITGNLKYDTPTPDPQPELERFVQTLAANRPILIAGSTMRGEDEQVLEAFRQLGGGEQALLILAPRHPERWDRVAQLTEEQNFSCLRRSTWQGQDPHSPQDQRPDVLLLDSLGELAALYRIADSAFIGGTLVPTGGHNPLEPAHFGIPTAVGPAMDNFLEMATQFDAEQAWERVASAAELAETWLRWLRESESARQVGERAAALLRKNQGAVERTLTMLEPLMISRPRRQP